MSRNSTRSSTRALIESLGRRTADAPMFLAPCVRGGTVIALIDGLVQRLMLRPSDFEGWGIFSMQGRHAQLFRAANRRLVDKTMKGAVTVRMILLRPLCGSAWLALPQHQQAFTTRFGATDPVVVQLVDGADALGGIIARRVGRTLWFDRTDRRANTRQIKTLRDALEAWMPAAGLRLPGLTPEWRRAYAAIMDWRLGAPVRSAKAVNQSDRQRLRSALRMGGGRLTSFVDRGAFWSVEWIDREGHAQVSAINKDMTVIDSGICLSDADEMFDLQSLAGVYAQREPWA